MNMIRKTEAWLDTSVKDEVLMMHGETGRFMSLNESAGVVWAALDQPRSREDLISALTDVFDVDLETASADLDECLSALEKEGAIVVEAG